MGTGARGGDALSSPPMDHGYALFDLDHTLLPHDTQVLFCNYVLRREGWRRAYLLWFLPCLPLAVLRLLSLRTMKRPFSSYLWGMKRETLERHIKGFLESDFDTALYPAVVAEVKRHRAEGRSLILNSASPEFYLKGIAAKGVMVTLPHSVFRLVRLPANLQQEVTVNRRVVNLSIQGESLRIEAETLWSSASVQVQAAAGK